MGGPFDPRSVCNLILDEADGKEIEISHLPLQKILYFLHGFYLKQTGNALVSGFFEAWKDGPVHPLVYSAFKAAGRDPIRDRAERMNIMRGENEPVAPCDDPLVKDQVEKVLFLMGRLPASRLRQISHAQNAPWDLVVKKRGTSPSFGMRISNDIIKENFARHKVSVGELEPAGEPDDDSPFA